MKIPVVRRPAHRDPVPMLPIGHGLGRRPSWPSERLERLLTPHEVDDLARGHFTR
ncbi:hypothetical protein ACFWPA_16220 [Rhodococcus sp. NPDC058505]|uniref:hypothetical protein n=1 Tax=unclassified Rhodococcus (in: high G+C Gram-positive bacteria) TaxID=192944 RepID=UPI00364D6554